MQTSEIISVNLWQILISLANLVIIFLILKKFLFAPVQKVFRQRQSTIDSDYAAAEEAKTRALADQAEWEQKRQDAHRQAEELIKAAGVTADRRSDEILAEARERAVAIVEQAEAEAELERKKADAVIRHEIVEVSAQLTGKLLEREIRPEDHRSLIDSFIEEMGEDDGADR